MACFTMDENLVKIRRHEVNRELERLKERVAALSNELHELDITQRVLERLSGAKRGSTSAGDQSQSETASQTSQGSQMSIRAMIKEALMDARQRGLPGLAPRHIREYISSTYHRDVGQQINTTASRMWRDLHEIDKDEKIGLFSLPPKENPEGEQSVQDTPSGLFSTQHDREAGQGGGT